MTIASNVVPFRARQGSAGTSPDTRGSEPVANHAYASLAALTRETRLFDELAQASAKSFESQSETILAAARQIEAAIARLGAMVEWIRHGDLSA